MTTTEYNNGVSFNIIEHIGVLATFPTGWKKELNFVSWNGAPGKYDIRDWDPSHTSMSRGMTFKENEMRLLLDLMRRRRRGGYGQSPRNVNAEAPVSQELVEEIKVAEPEVIAEAEPEEAAGVPVSEIDELAQEPEASQEREALDNEF